MPLFFGRTSCDLQVPYKLDPNPWKQHQNWLAVERWATYLTRNCLSASGMPQSWCTSVDGESEVSTPLSTPVVMPETTATSLLMIVSISAFLIDPGLGTSTVEWIISDPSQENTTTLNAGPLNQMVLSQDAYGQSGATHCVIPYADEVMLTVNTSSQTVAVSAHLTLTETTGTSCCSWETNIPT
jgi:hypothetical protein